MVKLNERLRSSEGFTLIELLIVIIILGILVAIVIFGVATFRSDAIQKACQADKQTVQIAAQAYLAKTGTTAADQSSAGGSLVTQGYLRSWPTSSDYAISLTGGNATSNLGGC